MTTNEPAPSFGVDLEAKAPIIHEGGQPPRTHEDEEERESKRRLSVEAGLVTVAIIVIVVLGVGVWRYQRSSELGPVSTRGRGAKKLTSASGSYETNVEETPEAKLRRFRPLEEFSWNLDYYRTGNLSDIGYEMANNLLVFHNLIQNKYAPQETRGLDRTVRHREISFTLQSTASNVFQFYRQLQDHCPKQMSRTWPPGDPVRAQFACRTFLLRLPDSDELVDGPIDDRKEFKLTWWTSNEHDYDALNELALKLVNPPKGEPSQSEVGKALITVPKVGRLPRELKFEPGVTIDLNWFRQDSVAKFRKIMKKETSQPRKGTPLAIEHRKEIEPLQ